MVSFDLKSRHPLSLCGGVKPWPSARCSDKMEIENTMCQHSAGVDVSGLDEKTKTKVSQVIKQGMT